MTLEEKIKDAEAVLKLAADMSRHYYDKPLIITYSGGKDSDVMLDIAKKCLNVGDFEVVNSHTTVDAPETVYHIREVFADLESQGIKTEIKKPVYKGERTSMWKLIKDMGIPPTRLMRYCCSVLKESTTPNRMVAFGVREEESINRQGRDAFSIRGQKGEEWRTLEHTFAMYQIDKTGIDGSYECEIIKACKENKDTLVQPIYKFTIGDIWEYVKQNNVKMNPLYEKGYDRVGCIGCPMGNCKQQRKQFNDYPKYKENYIRAFDRMLEARRAKNKPFIYKGMELQTGEEVMRWWLGENPKQVTFDDIIGG